MDHIVLLVCMFGFDDAYVELVQSGALDIYVYISQYGHAIPDVQLKFFQIYRLLLVQT